MTWREPDILPPLSPMSRIMGKAPLRPNVVSDGSLLHGENVNMGLGAFATRHPNRPTPHHLATIQELEMTGEVVYPKGEDGGYSVHLTSLSGPFPSATRTEACGILACYRAPYPINNGSDNKGAIGVAQSILNGMQGLKPWPMRNNGDPRKRD